jgi:hypothetical protein
MLEILGLDFLLVLLSPESGIVEVGSDVLEPLL